MSETITLPRSGLVLTQDPEMGNYPYLALVVEQMRFRIERVYVDGTRWRAVVALAEVDGSGIGAIGTSGSLDECIAWLDARVLELRAALLPADARERVARALWESMSPKTGMEYELHPEWRLWDSAREGDKDWYFEKADAVLAALGGQP